MKMRDVLSVPLFLLTLMINANSYSKDVLPILEGRYLGQKTPSSMPVPFAPGVVTTKGYEYGGVFTPDMNEFIFIQGGKDNKHHFVSYKKKDNRWYMDTVSPRLGQPTFSPDGNIMYLGNRYKEKAEEGWLEVKSLGTPFNSWPIMRLTASSKRTYFFDEFKQDFTGDIRYSRIVDGKHEAPKLLGKNINSGKSFHPFIAADESYLIFDGKRDDGYGDSDLYISFKNQDGSWGNVVNLGDKINTDAWEAAGYVTPDGKYFFFNRTVSPGVDGALPNVDIYWVEAGFIEALRP
ncbi:hypothetical protein TDB9533_01104 [Thalassocella blandensis]|nr:hypothetical protein TDB9533_01104 [Thalassocella blandensis]